MADQQLTIEKLFSQWMTVLNAKEKPAKDIIAFNFGLLETDGGFAAYLMGAKSFDPDDGDWACNIDYEPEYKYMILDQRLTKGMNWENVLERMTQVIGDYIKTDEFNSSILKNATAITTGFDDGDLVRLK